MNSLRVALAKVRWSLNHRGVLGTLKTAATKLFSRGAAPASPNVHPFDTEYGVDTSGLITAVNLTTGHPNDLLGTGYYGVPPSRFRFILQQWMAAVPEQPVESYSFIDIGCGKGRPLMLATELPFREIIGVELNPDLANIATANLQKWKAAGHPAPPTRVLCQDATQFEFPGTPCLVYLYNPFAEPVLRQFIEQMERSFSANPRPLDVFYCNPSADRLFAKHPSYRLLWSGPMSISDEDAAIDPFAASAEPSSLYRRVA